MWYVMKCGLRTRTTCVAAADQTWSLAAPLRPANAACLPSRSAPAGHQLVPQPRGHHRDLVRHVGEVVVDVRAAGGGRPVDAGRPVPERLEQLVDRRDGDQVGLGLGRVDLDRPAGVAAGEHAVVDHAVLVRPDAGDQRRVVRPGDGRVDRPHPLAGHALGGQLPDRRDRRGRVVEQVRREPVDRDDDHVRVGHPRVGRRLGRPGERRRDERSGQRGQNEHGGGRGAASRHQGDLRWAIRDGGPPGRMAAGRRRAECLPRRRRQFERPAVG
jgi:hypothetical protein